LAEEWVPCEETHATPALVDLLGMALPAPLFARSRVPLHKKIVNCAVFYVAFVNA
jgi:hypothetical protein